MGSIKHLTQKIKGLRGGENGPALLTAVIIILVSFASFGLGRLSVGEGAASEPVKIIYPEAMEAAQKVAGASTEKGKSSNNVPANISGQEGLLVASKQSDKYHYPWCAGAARINEQNKIWFVSKEEAERAGYKPASNCPGLQ